MPVLDNPKLEQIRARMHGYRAAFAMHQKGEPLNWENVEKGLREVEKWCHELDEEMKIRPTG